MIILELNLPKLSAELFALVQDHVNNVYLDPSDKQWLDNFHGITNTVGHNFSFMPEIEEQVRLEYNNFFPNKEIHVITSVIKNLGRKPGCIPPHYDRGRLLAINYYISLGGDSVDTVFYNQKRPVSEKENNIVYAELTEVDRYTFPTGWYAFNVCQTHSVENIVGNRCFFAITWKDSKYQVEDFIKDYPTLIKNKLRD